MSIVALLALAFVGQPTHATHPTSVSTPAVLKTDSAGVVLWRDIKASMDVAELRARYPQTDGVSYKDDRTILSDVAILEGCEAKVNILHPEGRVKEIVMRGEGSIAGRCSLKIITALSGKYGEPLEKDKVGGSLFAREGKNYVWAKDGVALQFKRYTNGPLGGGGLLAASWELRYSANATNIDL
jgi:hypothetical protein